MKFPFVSRWAYEDLQKDYDNMVWAYEKNLDLAQAKLNGLGERINELENKNDVLLQDNRTLLDKIRELAAELAMSRKEAADLRLLKGAIEARWAQRAEEADG